MSGVAAIILAAGRGARFSDVDNKLLAELDGRPLLSHAAQAALASHARSVIVVTGRQRDEIMAALAGLPVAFVHNPDFASGLASSLRAGLTAAAGADAVLILLGDMPRVAAPILNAIIAAFEERPDCAAIVPTYRGARGNPVLLARAVFPRLMALQGDEGARRLLREMEGVVELPVDDTRILADVDAPADLERFRRS
jgi:molybdenum cofactor cytidylyltransferase